MVFFFYNIEHRFKAAHKAFMSQCCLIDVRLLSKPLIFAKVAYNINEIH